MLLASRAGDFRRFLVKPSTKYAGFGFFFFAPGAARRFRQGEQARFPTPAVPPCSPFARPTWKGIPKASKQVVPQASQGQSFAKTPKALCLLSLSLVKQNQAHDARDSAKPGQLRLLVLLPARGRVLRLPRSIIPKWGKTEGLRAPNLAFPAGDLLLFHEFTQAVKPV